MSPDQASELASDIAPFMSGFVVCGICMLLATWILRRIARELRRIEPVGQFEEHPFSAVHPSPELGVAASPEGDESRAEGRPCISSAQDVQLQKADDVTAEGARAAGASSAWRSGIDPEEGVFGDFPASGPVQDGSASDGGRVVTFSEESAQGSCASDLPDSEGAEFSRRGQPGSQHGKKGGE